MPIYEYQCTSCHHHFDLMQKISDDPIKLCPNCDHNAVIKLVSAAGFQLKGTGWYATDFKNKNNPPNKEASETAKTTESNQTAEAVTNSTQSSSTADSKKPAQGKDE
jgi:putative FmdB family regulatory protein